MDRYNHYNNNRNQPTSMGDSGGGMRMSGASSNGLQGGAGDTASIIKQQDLFLEQIGAGLDAQGNMANTMQEEMVSQNQIIEEDLPESVDEAMARLQKLTRKAKEMRKAAGLGWYYLWTAVLFMAFCVILIFGVTSGGFENGGFGACGEDDDDSGDGSDDAGSGGDSGGGGGDGGGGGTTHWWHQQRLR